MLHPLPSACPAGRAPDPGVFTAAVARYRALERLREFRSRLYGCLARRPDVLFELADDIPVRRATALYAIKMR